MKLKNVILENECEYKEIDSNPILPLFSLIQPVGCHHIQWNISFLCDLLFAEALSLPTFIHMKAMRITNVYFTIKQAAEL
jgi:hypothetical protein